MEILAVAALGIVAATSLALWLLGNRFARRFVQLHAAAPRLTWMFRRADDPELEHHRRLALLTLPFYLVGIVTYLAATGPLS